MLVFNAQLTSAVRLSQGEDRSKEMPDTDLLLALSDLLRRMPSSLLVALL